jgi:hypothetical protein
MHKSMLAGLMVAAAALSLGSAPGSTHAPVPTGSLKRRER